MVWAFCENKTKIVTVEAKTKVSGQIFTSPLLHMETKERRSSWDHKVVSGH